jgi:hypothetical protein
MSGVVVTLLEPHAATSAVNATAAAVRINASW